MRLFRSTSAPAKRVVARHEQLLFYPSYGARSEDGSGWSLWIQGRVFDPRVTLLRRKPTLGVLRRVLRMDRTAEEYFRARIRQFLMLGLRGRSIFIQIGDHEYCIGESDYMGLFRGEIHVSNEQMARVGHELESTNGWLPFQAHLSEKDDRQITGMVQMVEPKGISIISDVDDTIKHSNVPNRRDLFRNTFTRTFVSVSGMPELYRNCGLAGTAFHFVSGSPWQLYEPLSEFMAAEGYPMGSFHLKRFRIRDTARKIRMSPQKAHKRSAIEPILAAFPQRKFILIGDSGEQDPEIYAGFLRERPEQIAGVFIRTVRDESRDAPRFNSAFDQLDPLRWGIYRDPAEISANVAQLISQ